MELDLVALLRAAWIAGTLPILIASIPSSRLHSFHGLVLGFARRGKTMPSSSYVSFTFCLADGKREENGTSLNCVFSFVVILVYSKWRRDFFFFVCGFRIFLSFFLRFLGNQTGRCWICDGWCVYTPLPAYGILDFAAILNLFLCFPLSAIT